MTDDTAPTIAVGSNISDEHADAILVTEMKVMGDVCRRDYSWIGRVCREYPVTICHLPVVRIHFVLVVSTFPEHFRSIDVVAI